MCKRDNISFILYLAINKRFHMRDLHLNNKGATRLAQNFRKNLSDI